MHCQRWDSGRHSWRHPDEGGFDRHRYDVATVPESLARPFVEAHHYSRRYVAARLAYGLYEAATLVGVAVLSVPMQAAVLTNILPDLVPYRESLELGRFVLLDRVPANGESWFLARCWELAARDGVRGVVSFSDPVPRRDAGGALIMPGHLGIIYQATNAIYTGRSTPKTMRVLLDGTVFSERAISKLRGSEVGSDSAERQLVAAGARQRQRGEYVADWLPGALALTTRTVRHHGNHRYVFALGRGRRHLRVALPGQPYPKRLDVG